MPERLTNSASEKKPSHREAASRAVGSKDSGPSLSAAEFAAGRLVHRSAIRAVDASRSLIPLQRVYGNRYVQRVVTAGRLSRDSESSRDNLRTEPKEAPPAPEKAPLVQPKCSCCAGEVCTGNHDKVPDVRDTALGGVAGANAPLPHLHRIQASFGRHDVSEARAQIGAEAADANTRMGSLAYTAGNRVAFGRDPDIRLAAHEAAHVVQQRNGAKLPAGVGRPGDEYEQQADAAAEAVALGQSAEPILDHRLGGDNGSSSPAVQHQLQADAVHLFEPPVMSDLAGAQVGGGGDHLHSGGKAPLKNAAAANKDPNPLGGTQETGNLGAKGASPGGAAPSSPAPGQGAPAQGGAVPTAAGSACNGAGAASCYNEDVPDPAEDEQQGEPADPPPTKAQEQVSGEVPDVPQPDDCPAQPAVGAAAEGSGGTGAASGSAAAAGPQAPPGASAGPQEGAVAGGNAPSDPAAHTAPKATARGGGGGHEAVPSEGADNAPAENSSPLGSSVGSSEAKRKAAVSAYAVSSSHLRASLSRISVLRAGIKFPPAPDEDGTASAGRAEAGATAARFFGDTAEQLTRSGGFALEASPTRLGAQAETAKAQIAASIERQKSAISTRIELARKQARSQAATALHQIEAQAARVAQSAAAVTIRAVATLHASHEAALQQVNQQETATLDKVNHIYSEGRARHEQLGTKIGDECTTRGEQFVAEYEHCKINRRDSIMKGHLTDRRAEAQQNAARETAKGFRKQLIDSARTRALDVVKAGRQNRRCAVIAAANASRSTLDTQLAKLVQSLESARDSATASANQARDSQVGAIRSTLVSTLRQLSAQEHDQRQAADDTGYIQQLTQEEVAHTSASALQTNVVHAIDGAVSGLVSARSQLTSGGPPNPEGLNKGISVAAPQVRSMTGALQSGIETAAGDAQSGLAGLANQGLGALDNVARGNDEMTASASSAFVDSIGQISGGAASAFRQMQDGFAHQIPASAEQGSAALAKVTAGMVKACDTVTSGASAELDQSARDLETALRHNKGQMECEIPKKANQAAAREAPAWKKVLAVVLIIVVVVIMIVATVVTFGAGGIVAGIIVGAIVGAVTSGMLYAASTLLNNQKWSWSAFGKAVAVGAVTGAVGGGLGAGLGGAVKGASVLIRLSVAVGVGAATDVLAQWMTQDFSLKKFNWTELGTTVLIAIVTFGIGAKFGGRYNVSYGPKGGGGKGFTFTRVTPTGAGGAVPHGGETPEPGAPAATETGTPAPTEHPGAPAGTEQPSSAPAPSDQVTPPATTEATAPVHEGAGPVPEPTAEPVQAPEAQSDALPAENDKRVRIIRQDDDFQAALNRKNAPKSRLSEDGSMMPVNPNGEASPLEHIYGSMPAKGDSPYTSFMAEEGRVAKAYGAQEVELNVPKLQADIASGKLTGVEVLTPPEIESMIRADIQRVAPGVDADAAVAGGPAQIEEFVASQNLSRSKSVQLARRLLALYNTTRDGEYLIKGIIPPEYLSGPSPTTHTNGSGPAPSG